MNIIWWTSYVTSFLLQVAYPFFLKLLQSIARLLTVLNESIWVCLFKQICVVIMPCDLIQKWKLLQMPFLCNLKVQTLLVKFVCHLLL